MQLEYLFTLDQLLASKLQLKDADLSLFIIYLTVLLLLLLISESLINLIFYLILCRRGPNRWRDGDSPIAILDDWLRKNGHPAARWHDHNTSESESSDCDRTMVTVKGQDYTLDMFGK